MTKIVLEKESCTLTRINLEHNLHSHLTKGRVIHDFTGIVKGSTLSLEIFSGEDSFDSLSECVFIRIAQYVKECLELLHTARDFLYVNLYT